MASCDEIKSVVICGKRYRVVFANLKHNYGECDDPVKKHKKIRICRNLRETDQRMFLETLIEELLHAADYSKDEHWSNEFSRDVANILWRFGFRIQEE